MKTNTSKYLPYGCVTPILMSNPENLEYPYLSGTGFFCYFPQYEFIFLVTAKHCVLKEKESEICGYFDIPYALEDTSLKKIVFRDSFYTEDEDVLVLVVDPDINKKEFKTLKSRAINLTCQEDVDYIIKILCESGDGRVRTLGFSQPYQSTKPADHSRIIYKDDGKQQLELAVRGFYGKIEDNSSFDRRYGFEESSWSEVEYRGFSGSPVISLIRTSNKHVDMRVIGVMLTATKSRGEFISINVATNLIASYINGKTKDT